MLSLPYKRACGRHPESGGYGSMGIRRGRSLRAVLAGSLLFGGLTAVSLAATTALMVSTASASPATLFSSNTSGPYSVTVPAGVTVVNITAVGGSGGGGGFCITSPGGGGEGAVVTSTATVNPGDTLTVAVAGNGVAENIACQGAAGGTGSGSGGSSEGTGGGGGGGGGASAVFDGTAPLAVAGGGGGAASWPGGSGGNAGQDAAGGGQAGSETGVGQGGSYGGNPGSGMDGGSGQGGGGGGGYYGGGGGGYEFSYRCVPSYGCCDCLPVGGWGGGGGSSYPAADVTGLDSTQTPSVTITACPCIATNSLPAATPGMPYGPVTLQATGLCVSTSPYTTTLKWKKVTLPKGLKLSKAGVLSGTPNAKLAAPTSVKVQVTETVITLNGKKKVKTKTTVQATIPFA